MRYLLVIAGSLGASLAVAAEAPVLAVPQVIARHEALNGKVARVRGWLLHGCQKLDCALSPRRDDRQPSLSLGGSTSFDLALRDARAEGHEILVEGRVNRTCFDHSKDAGTVSRELVFCTDRADELS
ncbi:MAG: hypothetical protein JF608_07845, partial [Sphingomonadales bacterium]|nr:hypothetical protein [Sphingomonadales bacterium]